MRRRVGSERALKIFTACLINIYDYAVIYLRFFQEIKGYIKDVLKNEFELSPKEYPAWKASQSALISIRMIEVNAHFSE